jgi:hypothetical protein
MIINSLPYLEANFSQAILHARQILIGNIPLIRGDDISGTAMGSSRLIERVGK